MDLTKIACFEHVQWRPTLQELRRFAVSMLIGFALLGLVSALRRHGLVTTTFVLWAAGVGLALGALVPGVGRLVYLAVHLPTGAIGFVVSHVLLTVVYFLVFTPLGFALRVMRKDLLRLQPPSHSTEWLPHRGAPVRESYFRQF